MDLTDVRRLTGANMISDKPGAAGEVTLEPGHEGQIVALWRRKARAILDAIGWADQGIRVRPYRGGASLAVTAPIDALYVATDVLEWAWGATMAAWRGEPEPVLADASARFRDDIVKDQDVALVAMEAAAASHRVTFLVGEDRVSIGLGTGGLVWSDDAVPDPADVDWRSVRDVPLGLVTGTNGKSTTVRLAAAIGAAAGRTTGLCSSDWVRVGGELVDEGDYSGPGGGRLAVRDERVELAVLEVARGGLMRRGLSFKSATACLITNVAADHLGDYGILDVDDLTEAKFLLTRTVEKSGRLILNADAPELVKRSCDFGGELAWFSLDPAATGMFDWCRAGGEAAYLKDRVLVLDRGGEAVPVITVDDFSLSLGGAARYNVANALGAIALSSALGLPVEAMTRGLAEFRGDSDDNPGRGNFLEIGGVRILVDFAHNPHGLSAVVEAVRNVPANRRLVLLGQAGDRRDEDIRELTRITWDFGPDLVIVKELAKALRGRQLGEVPALIRDELTSLGASDGAVATAGTEMEAVRHALGWAREGDFLMLFLHSERKQVMALFDVCRDMGWKPGQPVPG